MARKPRPPLYPLAEYQRHLRYDPDTGLLWWTRSGPKRQLDKPVGAIAKRGTDTFYRVFGISVRPGIYEKFYVHQMVFFFMTGRWPDPEVDHADQDGLNNRWSNLREATRSEQCANRIIRRNRLKGAYRAATKEPRWFSHIVKDGKKTYLGIFATEQEAHEAFVEASKRIHGKFHRA